ncbi:MAG TPA: replication initiation protein [Gammaproteobacteria bacterium]|nr:replication initiation protein [Gammaproteobacteria bacterium]
MGQTVTDVGLEKNSDSHELKKHAASIHCSNTLSLLQRKISNALLYHAYKELLVKEEHELTIKELCQLIAYHGNNTAAIKEALKGLLSTVIEWNVVNDVTGTEDWTASSILASVSLRGPICLYAYSPRMKQLLHSPTMFGKINLFIQSRFKSSYGLALYENCIRYRGLGFTKWFGLDIFRKLMGVPLGKYRVFRDFKRRVLDKSVEEVNTYSDLIVVPEIWREGKQVVKIRFSMKERAKKIRLGGKTKNEPIEQGEHEEDEMIIRMKQNYGLTPEQINQVMQDYERGFVLEKMALIELSNNFQQGKVNNLAAYLLSALKNNYQTPKTSLLTLTEQKIDAALHARDLQKLEMTIKKIRRAYFSYREQIIDQFIENLNSSEYSYFIEDFRDFAADSIRTLLKLQRNKYNQDTVMQAPQIKAMLRQFALKMLPDLEKNVISLEQFIEDLPEKSRAAWKELQKWVPGHELITGAKLKW